MKSNKKIKLLILILFLIEISLLFLTYKSFSNRKIDELIETYEIEKKQFSMFVENESGNYEEYIESNKFPEGFVLNLENSKCVDTKGNIIYDILSSNGKNITIKTNTTSYCYLYFDQVKTLGSQIIAMDTASDIGLQQTLANGLYRFAGTNGNTGIYNYICLGADSCTSGSDNMYRVIGVNPTTGNVKVIKETPWNNNKTYSVYANENDTTYQKPLGTWFLTTMYRKELNQIYYELPFNEMIDTSYTWGASPLTATPTTRSAAAQSDGCSDSLSCHNAKIGIISVADYYWAYNADVNWGTSNGTWNNWISGDNNGNIKYYEWTMTYHSYDSEGDISSGGTVGWYIDAESGRIYSDSLVIGILRPTMYLKSDVMYVDGDGTSTNPFIVEYTKEDQTLSEKVLEYDSGLWDTGLQQTKITNDTLYRFAGTNGNTGIYNYICLGADSCVSGDDNMYRIIGVNPDTGLVKVIKQTPWNNGTRYIWHDANDTTFPSPLGYYFLSTLYRDTIYGIYDELSFKEMIDTSYTWGSSRVKSIATRSAAALADTGSDSLTAQSARVGILSVADYYLAYNGDKSWVSSYNTTTNWIGAYLNGYTTYGEWTMTYADYDEDDGELAWYISTNGGSFSSGNWSYNNRYVIRPTTYLKADVKYVSGGGTITNPYIVSY